MIHSIITQERLDRITQHVNEMTVGAFDDGEGGGLEVSNLQPINLVKRTEKTDQSVLIFFLARNSL